MSAPLAGKFQDHYVVLGVDPRANSETIQHAYTTLAAKYNPKGTEPDKEKFGAINQAYEVLSDIELRGEFNKLKGLEEEEGGPKFSGLPFFESLGREARLRAVMLCVLYDRRKAKPFTPSLTLRQLEAIIAATSEELNFTIWYLKQRGLVLSDDKSTLQITCDGMDFLEANRPEPDVILASIRPTGLAAPQRQTETAGGVRALASILTAAARSKSDGVECAAPGARR